MCVCLCGCTHVQFARCCFATTILCQQIRFFKGLTDLQKSRVADLMTWEVFDAEQVLIEVNTVSMKLFFTMKGMVSVKVLVFDKSTKICSRST